jgi:DNA-binding response OmpR family regulator
MGVATLGNLELDRDRFAARVDGSIVDLTYTQFAVLDELVRSAGRVVPQDELLRAVWGEASLAHAGRLRVQVSRLRKKLDGSQPWTIHTVQKRGYALIDASSEKRGRRRGFRRKG